MGYYINEVCLCLHSRARTDSGRRPPGAQNAHICCVRLSRGGERGAGHQPQAGRQRRGRRNKGMRRLSQCGVPGPDGGCPARVRRRPTRTKRVFPHSMVDMPVGPCGREPIHHHSHLVHLVALPRAKKAALAAGAALPLPHSPLGCAWCGGSSVVVAKGPKGARARARTQDKPHPSTCATVCGTAERPSSHRAKGKERERLCPLDQSWYSHHRDAGRSGGVSRIIWSSSSQQQHDAHPLQRHYSLYTTACNEALCYILAGSAQWSTRGTWA